MGAVNLDAAIESYVQLNKSIVESVKQAIEIAALDAVAMIGERILEKGQDSNNEPLSPYSKPYKKRKEKAGKYVGYTNLKWSGQMIASIGIIELSNTETSAKAVVMGRDEFNQKLLEYNSKSRGDILTVSKEEQKVLSEDFEKRVEANIVKLIG